MGLTTASNKSNTNLLQWYDILKDRIENFDI